MKRLIASSVVAAVALVFAAPAQPAAPSNAKLARQIKTLQKQVKTLKKQVKEADGHAALAIVYAGCATAVTADALQGTWAVIDEVNVEPIFGPQTPVNDNETMQRLGDHSGTDPDATEHLCLQLVARAVLALARNRNSYRPILRRLLEACDFPWAPRRMSHWTCGACSQRCDRAHFACNRRLRERIAAGHSGEAASTVEEPNRVAPPSPSRTSSA